MSSVEPASKPLLLLEDDDLDAELICRDLQREGWASPIERVSSISAAQRWLRDHSPRLILTDLNLHDSTELETVPRLRTLAPAPPMVVLTGKDAEGLVQEELRQGAQEYLLKDYRPHHLSRALRYAEVRVRRRHQRQSSAQTMAQAESRAAVGQVADEVADHLADFLATFEPCVERLEARIDQDQLMRMCIEQLQRS